MARLSVPREARILDVGCGTGVLLGRLFAAHPGSRLSGVDSAPQMLDIARKRLPEGIELREASAEHLPYPEAAFDIVVSTSMFHYLPDPNLALREMERVLRPGGTVVVTDWCADFLVCRICEAYLSIFREVRYSIHRSGEWLSLLAGAGFSGAAIDRYKVSWLWGVMTATARKP